jgi:hypothetical protein
MLVENWLTYTCTVSNLIHRSGVVTGGGKDFERGC